MTDGCKTMSAAQGTVSQDPGHELTWLEHARATLVLGLPLIGAQLAQIGISVTDTVMIGWLGAFELAAGVLGTQAFFLTFIFGGGFAFAVLPIAAQAHGREDVRGVRRSVRMGLWVILAYSALIMVPLWYTEHALLLLGQDPDTAALAGRYIQVAQWSMFPALIFMVLRSYLGALERAQIILWATLGGMLANALLNYMFIFGNFGAPRMEVVGAAVASLGTNLMMCLAMLVYAVRQPALRRYQLLVRFWRADWPDFFDILKLGLPISATILAETSLFAGAAVLVGWIGTIELAAHGIALQLAAIAFMLPLGLSSAATIRVGNAFGRRDWIGLDRAGWVAIALAIAVTLATALIFLIIPGTLVGLFLDKHNPDASRVLAVAVPLLFVAAAFQVVDGLQAMGVGLLRGLSDTRVPMVMAVFSYWGVGMSSAYLLGITLEFGVVGVWWGLALGLLFASVLMIWRYLQRERFGLVAGHPE